MSLPTPDIVRSAVLGEDGVAAGGKVEIICDLSTSGPRAGAGTGHRPRSAKGIASFDAPVSGGIRGRRRRARWRLMVGGPRGTMGRSPSPLLEQIGKPFYMGETPGAGQTMKLVNNLLGARRDRHHRRGHDAGHQGRARSGADDRGARTQSTGINSATRDKWPRAVLPRTFDFGFAAALSLKDTICDRRSRGDGRAPADWRTSRSSCSTAPSRHTATDADFTEMAKVVESDAGLDPDRLV